MPPVFFAICLMIYVDYAADARYAIRAFDVSLRQGERRNEYHRKLSAIIAMLDTHIRLTSITLLPRRLLIYYIRADAGAAAMRAIYAVDYYAMMLYALAMHMMIKYIITPLCQNDAATACASASATP